MQESGVFKQAVKLPPDERSAYLDKACGSNAALRLEVEGLLRAHDSPGEFMRRPPIADATTTFGPGPQRPGMRIGPYKLLQFLGEGGMGTVFLAEQSEPVRRMVALKIIKPGMDSTQVLARFEAERQALALMDHPNIAKVLDAGTTEEKDEAGRIKDEEEDISDSSFIPQPSSFKGRPYFVMELVKGVPLIEFCDKNKLDTKQRLELFIPICNAIQHAHMKGIIHRDIKPSNVLIALYDGKPVPKVIDFGVAKAMAEPLTQRTLFTQVGQIVGTFEYMSPEQATLNQLDIDTRSDIYSLGVLLYELLTGMTPLNKDQLGELAFDEMLRAIREEEPVRPSVRLSSEAGALAMAAAYRGTQSTKLPGMLRGELDWIVMKCLEKERDRRFVTAGSLAKDIERYLHDEPVTACPPSLGYRLRKAYRKHKPVLLAGAAIAAVLLLGVILSTWQAIRATNAEFVVAGQRDAAVKAKQEAAHQLRKRIEAQEKQRRIQYASDMLALPHVLKAGNIAQVNAMLEPHDPDLRGFEWDYWKRQTDTSLRTIQLEMPKFPLPIKGVLPTSRWAFSGNGKRVALLQMPPRSSGKLVGKTGLLTVWDVASGEPVLSKHEWPLIGGPSTQFGGSPFDVVLQISHDGKFVLLKREGRTRTERFKDAERTRYKSKYHLQVRVVEVNSGKEVLEWDPQTHKNLAFRGTTLSLTGNKLATIVRTRQEEKLGGPILKIWDLSGAKAEEVFSKPVAIAAPPVFSPDGRRVAGVVGVDGRPATKVWDTSTGEEQLTLDVVVPLCFSPDGKILAGIAAKDVLGNRTKAISTLTVKIFDADLGEERSTIPLPLSYKNGIPRGFFSSRIYVGVKPMSALFSPKGSRLAIVLPPGSIIALTECYLIDLRKGKLERLTSIEVPVDRGPLPAFFTPDETRFGRISDNAVRMVELPTGRTTDRLRGHLNRVAACMPIPKSQRLWSVGAAGELKEWDFYANEPKRITLPPHGPLGEYLATGPDGASIFAWTEEEKLIVRGIAERPKKTFPTRPFAGEVASRVIALSRTGKRLAFLRTASGRSVEQKKSGEQKEKAMSFPAGDLTVWDVDSGKELFFKRFHFEEGSEQTGRYKRYLRMALSPTGDRVALVKVGRRLNSLLRILDIRTGNLSEPMPMPASCFPRRFSPDGRKLALTVFSSGNWGSQTKSLAVWDVVAGRRLFQTESGKGDSGVWKMAWRPDSARLAISKVINGQLQICIYDAATGKEAARLSTADRFLGGRISDASSVPLVFSPDGKRIAYYVRPDTVKVWDADRGKELLELRVNDSSSEFKISTSILTFTANRLRLFRFRPYRTSDGELNVYTWDATPRIAEQP